VNDCINVNKKNKYLFIIMIVLVVLLVGGTLAYLIIDILVYNDTYNTVTTCLEVDYDISNDDGTIPISGDMFPSHSALSGLNGKVGLKIKDNCSLEGIGTLSLNVVTASSTLIQRVDGHCENSKTLETLSYIKSGAECVANSDNIWVSNGTALKYAVYDTDEIVDGVLPVSVGYINKTGKIDIYNDFPVTKNNVNYYIYIWLDGNVSDNSYAGLSFNGNISSKVVQKPEILKYKDSILNGADPVLDEGMIPVTISNDGVATVADTSSEWYNYTNKEWANVVLVNENATDGVDGSKSREYYKNNPGTTVVEDDILAYYVWIPRYKYQLWTVDATQTTDPQTINIVFENKSTAKSRGSAVGDYYTHPAFTFGDEEVNGIWVGKFETSTNTSSDCYISESEDSCNNTSQEPRILPNVKSLRMQQVSNQFITSLKFAGGTFNTSTGDVTFAGSDIYGLTTNSGSHMMKNSEWGAVAYLSHSVYGINQEIYINNSSDFYTGRSGGNVGGSQNTNLVQFGIGSDVRYSLYGYYTWIGQAIDSSGTIGIVTDLTLGTKASTTGNVTGIYDMAGGTDEYVMGNYNNISNFGGLTTFPESKYYDVYLINLMTFCTLEICGGQALFETAGWYSDSNGFVNEYYPWFARGGNYYVGAKTGEFYLTTLDGDGFGHSDSWRSVLVS